MTEIRRRHWIAALTAAMAVHAGAMAAIVWQSPPSGARSAGLGGIEIALAAGGVPGGAAMPNVPEAETLAPVDATPVEAAPIETSQAIPAETAAEIEAVETVPEAQEAEPLGVETAEPVAIAEAVPLVVSPPPARKPVPPQELSRTPPSPKPMRRAAPPATITATTPTEVHTTAAPPSLPGAEGKSGTGAQLTAGDAVSDFSGGGLPGATADYLTTLQAWLEKHKEYPARARVRRQQGTVLLYFEMSREGEIREAHIRKGSGHSTLDEEALALIKRAAPLPRPPADFGGTEIRMVIPVQFSLH